MKLRVGFSTTNSLMSRIIRWFTKSSVSHTYLRLDDKFLGTSLIFHSDFVGVVIAHADVFESKNIIIKEYEVEGEHIREAIQKHLSYLGRDYDWWNLFGWAWVIVFKRWAKKKISNPLEDPSKIICVDFCIRVLNSAKLTNLDLGIMTPEHLDKWVKENYNSLGWNLIIDNTA